MINLNYKEISFIDVKLINYNRTASCEVNSGNNKNILSGLSSVY